MFCGSWNETKTKEKLKSIFNISLGIVLFVLHLYLLLFFCCLGMPFEYCHKIWNEYLNVFFSHSISFFFSFLSIFIFSSLKSKVIASSSSPLESESLHPNMILHNPTLMLGGFVSLLMLSWLDTTVEAFPSLVMPRLHSKYLNKWTYIYVNFPFIEFDLFVFNLYFQLKMILLSISMYIVYRTT